MDKPSTLEECIKAFKDILSPQDQIEILKMPHNKLIMMHHGLGRWIRNNWGLWEKESPLYQHMLALGFCHPDDMSQAIIVEYWCRLNNQPSQLQNDIKISKEWAEKSKT